MDFYAILVTDYLYTTANATIALSSPGVIAHSYLDAPLLPQVEHWKVLSRYPDWMLFIYCGETPAGPYAGGSVVSRTARNISAIPPDIELDFAETARKFGFDYYEMCISDTSSCTNWYVQNWILFLVLHVASASCIYDMRYALIYVLNASAIYFTQFLKILFCISCIFWYGGRSIHANFFLVLRFFTLFSFMYFGTRFKKKTHQYIEIHGCYFARRY